MILDPLDGRGFTHLVILPDPPPVIEAGVSKFYWSSPPRFTDTSYIVADNEPPMLDESIFLK